MTDAYLEGIMNRDEFDEENSKVAHPNLQRFESCTS